MKMLPFSKKICFSLYRILAAMVKAWYRSRRNKVIIAVFLASCLVGYIVFALIITTELRLPMEFERILFHLDLEIASNSYAIKAVLKPDVLSAAITLKVIENNIQEALKYDKGTGCEMPILDPFDKEVTRFDKNSTPIRCVGVDWVKCYHSECKVVKKILDTTRDVVCTYRDIIYETDFIYHLGPHVEVYGDKPYILNRSDHVKISCRGKHLNSIFSSKWVGVSTGLRRNVSAVPPPSKLKDSINVLMFGFDSLSKNSFIRRMPKTYKYITEALNITFLHSYNIVGDGTPAALFPILTGMTEVEMPDTRRSLINDKKIDVKQFIFHKVQQYGYRTAFFEDMPSIGTFQYRFNGFDSQPADHYLRPFLQEVLKTVPHLYCLGDTPTHRVMMNVTEQILNLPNTKFFIFTFIVDMSHDDFNMIAQADHATFEFMKGFNEKGRTKDTLLILMSDHGSRYAAIRNTLQGRLEERLPLMAIRLPDDLTRLRPQAQRALQLNAHVLTTPHDIYATVLDALDLREDIPELKVPGADLPRAMSILEPIPKNRSCGEAAIEPHWCACVSWKNVPLADPMCGRAAHALLDYINELTDPVRSECAPRTLTSVTWVMKQQPRKRVLEFKCAMNADGQIGAFGRAIPSEREHYQVRMTVGPGTGIFEATLKYLVNEDKFLTHIKDISRTNMYHHEPDCIQNTHPHLNMFCYCKNQIGDSTRQLYYEV